MAHTRDMAATTINQKGESTMTHFSVTCPCGSGHTVEASDAGFSATTVTVAACQICRTAGIVSREMRKSYGVEHYGFNRDEFACLVHRLDPDDFTRCRVCGASSRSHAEAFALGLLRWEEMNGSWSSESE